MEKERQKKKKNEVQKNRIIVLINKFLSQYIKSKGKNPDEEIKIYDYKVSNEKNIVEQTFFDVRNDKSMKLTGDSLHKFVIFSTKYVNAFLSMYIRIFLIPDVLLERYNFFPITDFSSNFLFSSDFYTRLYEYMLRHQNYLNIFEDLIEKIKNPEYVICASGWRNVQLLSMPYDKMDEFVEINMKVSPKAYMDSHFKKNLL